MVKYKNIIQVIDKYISKCGPTIAEIQNQLNQLSQEEKYAHFEKENLLNVGERKWYDSLISKREIANTYLEKANENLKEHPNDNLTRNIKENIKKHKDQIKFYDEWAFKYERRIIEGYEKEKLNPPQIDVSNFKIEDDKGANSKRIGKLEQAQIDSQKNVQLDMESLYTLMDYYGGGYLSINGKLNNTDSWNNLPKEEQKKATEKLSKKEQILSNIINKSDGLVQDTVVWHGGYFDLSKEIGDKIEFNGYISTSFSKSVADKFKEKESRPSELSYTYKFLLPKGTKGWCANDTNQTIPVTGFVEEHEFLLDKGFKGQIVDIDYENQIITVA